MLVFENLTLRLLGDWLDNSASSLLLFVQISTQIGLSEVFHIVGSNTDLLAGDNPLLLQTGVPHSVLGI